MTIQSRGMSLIAHTSQKPEWGHSKLGEGGPPSRVMGHQEMESRAESTSYKVAGVEVTKLSKSQL